MIFVILLIIHLKYDFNEDIQLNKKSSVKTINMTKHLASLTAIEKL